MRSNEKQRVNVNFAFTLTDVLGITLPLMLQVAKGIKRRKIYQEPSRYISTHVQKLIAWNCIQIHCQLCPPEHERLSVSL